MHLKVQLRYFLALGNFPELYLGIEHVVFNLLCGSEYTIVFPDVYCNYFTTEYVKNAARRKKHLVSCSKAPS
jgi:hypothetical protein